MKVTKEILSSTQKQLAKDWVQEEKYFQARKELHFKPVLDLLEQHYDEVLLDANGKIVKAGDVITNGTKRYWIETRSMEFKKGEFGMNPQVFVRPLLKSGQIDASKNLVVISPVFLKNYTVVEVENGN